MIGPHNAVCCYEVGEDVVAAINRILMSSCAGGLGKAAPEPGSRKSETASRGWNTGKSDHDVQSMHAVPGGSFLFVPARRPECRTLLSIIGLASISA